MTETITYIETEIGLMPDDWDIVSIGSEFNIQQGKQVSARHRAGDNEKSFLRTANLFWNRIDLTVLDRMHFTAAEELRMKLHVNDVLVCEGGDVGRTALVSTDLNGIYYQNHLHRLRVKNESTNPLFFVYWMMYCLRFTEYYNGAGNKTTIPNLSQSRLKALLFPKPEKEEQDSIAHVLSLIQTAIQKQEQIISTTTALKNALIKKLFTEGVNNEPRKKTEIGLIPERWEVVALKNIIKGKLRNGAFIYKPEKGSGMLFVNVVDMYGGIIMRFNSLERLSVDESSVKEFLLEDNDILFVRSSLKRAGVGQCCLIKKLPEKVFYDCHLIKIAPNTEFITPEFLVNYFRSDIGKTELIKRSKTTTMTTISQQSLALSLIPIPPKAEQTSIVETLSACEAKIEFHTNKKQTLKSLFSSSLHQLMTGKTRINDSEMKSKKELIEINE